MKQVQIYGLACPETHQVRYVGKSKDARRRYHEHMCLTRKGDNNFHLYRWLKLLHRHGLSPELIILETVDVACWVEREKYWIAHFGLATLCNMNAGGFEPPDCTGRVCSQATREKCSKARKGVPIWIDGKQHPMFGKQHPCKGKSIHTEEAKEQMRLEKLGVRNSMYGKHISEEQSRQRSERQSIPVSLVDDDGKIIETYPSATEAAKQLKLDGAAITRTCKGEYKQTHGYKFIYATSL